MFLLRANRYVNYVEKYKELVEKLLILLENPVRVNSLADGKKKYYKFVEDTSMLPADYFADKELKDAAARAKSWASRMT